MYKIGNYTPDDSMSELICNHYPMLMVINRFGISLGIGEATIGEVCQKCGVPTHTFLVVVNMLLTGRTTPIADPVKLSETIDALLQYLTSSHKYFLNFRLKEIGEKLFEAIKNNKSELNPIIKLYFDQYVAEVNEHMTHEEQEVFPYIRTLLKSQKTVDNYSIDNFSKHHDNIENKLSELKDIIIKYYDTDSTNELTSALYDIFACAQDLLSHNDIENSLLVPMVKEYEKQLQ